MTAIHIAFGGKLEQLKRQKSLEEVIKKGEKEAFIKISINEGVFETESTKPKLLTVATRIKGKKDQIFFVDDKRVERRQIIQLAKKYQIQMSNVCQFLPQEVVSDFAKKKPLEIFQDTLTAIGNV